MTRARRSPFLIVLAMVALFASLFPEPIQACPGGDTAPKCEMPAYGGATHGEATHGGATQDNAAHAAMPCCAPPGGGRCCPALPPLPAGSGQNVAPATLQNGSTRSVGRLANTHAVLIALPHLSRCVVPSLSRVLPVAARDNLLSSLHAPPSFAGRAPPLV